VSEEPRDIGVLIIGGYLGSGKTTLVNHILRSGTGRETLVLVNDFGEIAIDGDLIEADSDGVVTLVNGCSCCALSTPLIEFLVSLRERETRPQLLIIEASGVANTALVASHAMIPGFRLEGVVTVVDAEIIGERLSDDYVGNTVQRQIEAADVLVINKTDLAGAVDVERASELLGSLAPGALVVEAVNAEVPIVFLLGETLESDLDLFEVRNASDSGEPHAKHETWSWECDTVINRTRFESVIEALPDRVLRVKGVVNFDASPLHRSIIQRVGSRLAITQGAAWGSDRATSRVVLIGLPGSINPEVLAEAFNAALI
jgi:G3E family GTPase